MNLEQLSGTDSMGFTRLISKTRSKRLKKVSPSMFRRGAPSSVTASRGSHGSAATLNPTQRVRLNRTQKRTVTRNISNCSSRSAFHSRLDQPMTPAEMFKVFVLIDREILREYKNRNQQFEGLSGDDLIDVDDLLTEAVSLSITDQDIEDQVKAFQIEELKGLGINQSDGGDYLGGLLKRIGKRVGRGIKKTSGKVLNVAKKVVKNAVHAVHRIVSFPSRAILTGALKAFRKGAAKAFAYIFIPGNHPVLRTNHTIARKRKRQLKAIEVMEKTLAFNRGYIKKQIRSGFIKKEGVSPEVWLNNQAKSGGLNGLGIVDPVTVAALATLLPLIPPVLKVFKPATDAVDTDDFKKKKGSFLKKVGKKVTGFLTDPVTGKTVERITERINPGRGNSIIPDHGGNDPDEDKSFFKSPLGILTVVAGGTLATWGIVTLVNK